MRRVRIVVGRSPGRLSAIAAVSILPMVASCGSRSGLFGAGDAQPSGGASSGGASSGGAGGATGGTGGGLVIGGGSGGVGASGGSGGAGGAPWCPSYGKLETFTVELPPPGVPAEPGQICAVSLEPVESNTAARVSLTKYSPALELAQGFVAIPPALEKLVVGTPKIEIESADVSALSKGQVSSVTQVAGGFSFHLTWPGPLNLKPEPYVRLVMKVELALACQEGDLRTVTSLTEIHLCIGEGDLEWVSSGDECTVCKIIAEMAPTPILPDQRPDALPLSRAFRLRLIELARAGNSALLFAENDAGADARYEWHASAGRLDQIAPDLVLWTMEPTPGEHLLQVAVEHADGAAVASADWVPL